jgi:NTP pyrophosphatase (non-canonical NTP hydrolase)
VREQIFTQAKRQVKVVGNMFVGVFQDLQKEIHDNARSKGWWDVERNAGELLMLAVTELAEACEALRQGNPPDDKIPEFNGMEAELADTVIRIMDFAEARELRLAEAIVAKVKFNKTREHKHGGKLF